MRKINNKNYKFKFWEKTIMSILTPLFTFLSAPLAILFAFIFAFIILVTLGPAGFIILGIAALLIYSIIKSAAQDD